MAEEKTDTIDDYAEKNNLFIDENFVMLNKSSEACDDKEILRIFNGLRKYSPFTNLPELKKIEGDVVKGQPYLNTKYYDGIYYPALYL